MNDATAGKIELHKSETAFSSPKEKTNYIPFGTTGRRRRPVMTRGQSLTQLRGPEEDAFDLTQINRGSKQSRNNCLLAALFYYCNIQLSCSWVGNKQRNGHTSFIWMHACILAAYYSSFIKLN